MLSQAIKVGRDTVIKRHTLFAFLVPTSMKDHWNTRKYFSVVLFQRYISTFSSFVCFTANKNDNWGEYLNKVGFSYLKARGLTPCDVNSFTLGNKHYRNNSLKKILSYFEIFSVIQNIYRK